MSESSLTARPPLPEEQKHEVTPLELFFDLVFVYGVSQLSHHLLEHLTWRGAAETLVLLLAIFTVWSYTSWETTITSVTRAVSRAKMLAVMLPGLFMNAFIPEAFGASAWAFVLPYLAIQLGRSVWTLLSTHSPLFRKHFTNYLIWILATAPLWVVGASADEQTRLSWWAAATAIDFLGAALAHPLPGRSISTENVGFDGDHMVERARLFLIIALGETVLVTGTAISEAPPTWMTVLTGSAGLLMSVSLWSLAFGRPNAVAVRDLEETRNPIRAAMYAVNSMTGIVAGLILLAVGIEKVIVHSNGHSSLALNLLVFGGPALVLLMQTWYVWVLTRTVSHPRLLGAAALLVACPLTLSAPPFVSLVLALALLGAVALGELEG
ncbi:low temperature requirement protein A [Deinococcus metallilatus]|uniref:Low temperature requirement protein LtrA n=1 Tax=Deinococcus metallilatus TaxID=1211322 RepID=A0ABR6MUZ5_9DEIO|nr:low temperature requirement protein A [Deinococcus metallilatus]MBB5295740.1 low temperature requirement protein LtrA [Deinococcus metallilatus]GMA14268.1 membrane protein [Deinococcus metallilatus]